jgi:hypothetical protein
MLLTNKYVPTACEGGLVRLLLLLTPSSPLQARAYNKYG